MKAETSYINIPLIIQFQPWNVMRWVRDDCHVPPVWFIECILLVGLFLWEATVYPKKYAHGFVVICFVVVMRSFIMNSHEVFIHIHQGCFAGFGAIVRLPQCQWSKPDGYGKISQRITTTKHSKAKTVCIFLGMYCNSRRAAIYRRQVGPSSIKKKSRSNTWTIFSE